MNNENMTEMEAMLRMQRDNLRSERNIMVAMLAKVYPSTLAYHTADENGDDGGDSCDGYVCYVLLPTGQISFHIGTESRSTWFEHVQLSNIPVWDGHDTELKWKRIVDFIDKKETT